MDGPADVSSTVTVVGLFDDQIDAEQALTALRKSDRPSSTISVLARDRTGDEKASSLDVTRAVMDSAMASVSGWLTGLATLMVPDHGTLLAAGPIGTVLAKMKADAVASSESETPSTGTSAPPTGVDLALSAFGFTLEEAHYLEQRLAAGSVLIAVTANDKEQVAATLRTFGDFDAVFVGQAETSNEIVTEAERWIAHPLAPGEAEVIVADVVVTLRHVCTRDQEFESIIVLCGLPLVDERGDSPGDIDDILIDATDDTLVRYVIAGHGGIFGIARHRHAVPGELCRLEEQRVVLLCDASRLDDAPAYDQATPFSRKDELEIHQHFETRPYWLES